MAHRQATRSRLIAAYWRARSSYDVGRQLGDVLAGERRRRAHRERQHLVEPPSGEVKIAQRCRRRGAPVELLERPAFGP